MKGVHNRIEFFLDTCAKDIIDGLNKNFDSHDFIIELIKNKETEYIIRLSHCKTFQNFHRQVGRYLKEKAIRKDLTIKSIGRGGSPNIKRYNSQNEKWEKTN